MRLHVRVCCQCLHVRACWLLPLLVTHVDFLVTSRGVSMRPPSPVENGAPLWMLIAVSTAHGIVSLGKRSRYFLFVYFYSVFLVALLRLVRSSSRT